MSILLITACSKDPKPIQYGQDQCAFCSMAIVQKTHASQLVTDKGKQYKFDAIECMVNYVKNSPEKAKNASLLVADYNQPEKMISAEEATYLISKNLPSPMGAYLTAFKTKADAKEVQKKLDGKIFQWDELKEVINKDKHQSQ
jgi:copper chaperone NosL